jgi:hypothetical protein
MLPKLMLPFFFVLIFNGLQAQTLTVSGRLQDGETRAGVPGATVVLKSLRDTTRSFTLTSDGAGAFRFTHLAPDSFRLTASSVGYETLSRVVRLKSSNVFLGSLIMPKASKELTGVTVTGRIPPAVQKGDTVEFNAGQFKVNPDASAEDLARKIPGITVENGQVTANGENVRRVTIDGRELFGEDATAALRNLPAEVIDKIQVFDRLSDQAQLSGIDDGNTTKEINIITKANMRNGQFGRVYGGYGTDDRYSAGGNTTFLKGDRRVSIVGNFNNVNQQNFAMQDLLGVTANNRGGGRSARGSAGGRGGSSGGGRPNGGNSNFGSGGNFLVGQQAGINTTHAAGINFSDVWGARTTVTGSYLFNNTGNRAYEEQDRKYFAERVQSLRDTSSNDGHNYNHRINLRLEYRLAPRAELIITPNLSFQDNNSERERRAMRYRVIDSTERVYSRILNDRASDRSGNNLNNTILYRQSFAKRGRSFTASLNTAYNKRVGETYIVNQTSRFGSDFSEQRRFTDQYSRGLQLSANLTYTEPLGERSQLQVNYNPTYSRSQSDVQSFLYDTVVAKYSEFDSLRSNRFTNRSMAQNGGITFRRGTKDNAFALGVNYQHTVLNSTQTFPRPFTLDQSFNNVLPNALLRFKLSQRSNMRLVYRASVELPSITQLSEVQGIPNHPFLRIGNSALEPQYNHVLSSRYTYTNTATGMLFMANVFAQKANNYIGDDTYVADSVAVVRYGQKVARGEELTRPVNLDGYASLRSFVTLAMPINGLKTNLNLNGGASFFRYPGLLNDTLFESRSQVYSLGTVLSSNISEQVDFTVSYSANYNLVKNDAALRRNDNYFRHVTRAQLNLLSKNGWLLQSDLNNQWFKGISDSFNESYWLWNAGVGKKFLKDQKGELRLNVFDLLNQNQDIERTISDVYIEDAKSQVLQRYFMLTFTYNLRNFGKGTEPQAKKGKGRKTRVRG